MHAKQQYHWIGIWVEYAGSNDHIFTPERLQEICEMEATFYRPPEYRDVCVLDDDGQCVIPPLSIVGQFYGEWLAGLVRNGDGNLLFVGDCRRRGNVDKYGSAARSRRHGNSMVMEKRARKWPLLKNGFSWRKGQLSALRDGRSVAFSSTTSRR